MALVSFYSEDVSFKLQDQSRVIKWIMQVATNEGYSLSEINYIFCSDEYLLRINRDFLQHDYYTDIITFDNSDVEKEIMSDVFVSIDRVKENADNLNVPFLSELHRVLIHGLLHLVGYTDKTLDDQMVMRKKEDACLSLLKKF